MESPQQGRYNAYGNGVYLDDELSSKYQKYLSDDNSTRFKYRVTGFAYCQSRMSNNSFGSYSSDDGQRRLRSGAWINHDFVVVHIREEDLEGTEVRISIFAEKLGAGRDGPGIYVGVLTNDEIEKLPSNILKAWTGISIPVQLDVLIGALVDDVDAGYKLFTSNCWNYARAACKKVLRLLSRSGTWRQMISFQFKAASFSLPGVWYYLS